MRAIRHLRLVPVCLWLAASAVMAGPPYVTDDPEPTEVGHWEIFAFGTATRAGGDTEGETGLDMNYGAAPDLQLTAVVPVAFEAQEPARVGDIELGIKYRLLHQRENGLLPDLAFFPTAVLPTGHHEQGAHKTGLFLPLWAQKDIGPWSLFGGGGYMLHPGRDNRDFWEEGIALTREIGPRLTIGVEVYHQGAEEAGEQPYSGVNAGVTYQLNERWSLLASGGPGIQNAHEAGRFNGYAALLANF